MPYAAIACPIVFFWSIAIRTVFYTVLPAIALQFALSNAEGASLASAMQLGYCAGLFGAGWLPGNRPQRIIFGIVLSLIGVVILWAASAVPVITAGAMTIGLGIGCYLPQGIGLITEVSPPNRRARYMSLHEFAATAASFVGAAYVALFGDAISWNILVLASGVVGVGALLAMLPVREPVPVAGDKPAQAAGGAKPAVSFRFDRLFWACVVSYTSINLLLAGLISVLPLIMVRAWGADVGWAAAIIGWTRLAGLAGILVSGALGDRFGSTAVLGSMYVISLLGTLAMAAAPLGDGFVVGLLVVAAGASGSILLFAVVMATSYPPGERERALGLGSALANLGGNVVAPYLFGTLLDAGWDRAPFWIVAATVALCLVLLRTITSARHTAPATSTT